MIWAILTLCATFAFASDELMTYAPKPDGDVVFLETFQNGNGQGSFVKSEVEKYNGQPVSTVADASGLDGDLVMSFDEPAKHYAVTAQFAATKIGDKLVVQYEARFNTGLDCGGAYVKLLGQDSLPNLANVDNDTPYIIMFGPDKCGSTTRKIHLILRHQNPISGEWEEKHLKDTPSFTPKKTTQLFTLIINGDDSFQILVDSEEVSSGSLMSDFEPPINPPKQIPDPEDLKPEDWVDEAEIPDPEASKPDDWDEDAPRRIEDPDATIPSDWLETEDLIVADPTAQIPEDWDEDEDGEWEAPQVSNPKCEGISGCGEWNPPMIANPDYKGKWSAPMIDNPDFIGEWAPRQIDNPNFFELDNAAAVLEPIGAVSIEVWTMNGEMTFDNFLVAHDADVASSFATKTFAVKSTAQKAAAAEQVAEAKRLQHESLLDGSVSGYVQYGIALGLDNPLIALGVVVLMCLVLYVLLTSICCTSSTPKQETPRAATPADAKTDGEEPSGGDSGTEADETTTTPEAKSSKVDDNEERSSEDEPKDAPEENIDTNAAGSYKDKLRSSSKLTRRKRRTPKAE